MFSDEGAEAAGAGEGKGSVGVGVGHAGGGEKVESESEEEGEEVQLVTLVRKERERGVGGERRRSVRVLITSFRTPHSLTQSCLISLQSLAESRPHMPPSDFAIFRSAFDRCLI